MKFGSDPLLQLKALADRARKMQVMGKVTPEAKDALEEQFRSKMTFDVGVTVSRLFQDLNDIEDNAALEMSRIANLHYTRDAERCRSGCDVDRDTHRCETLDLSLQFLERVGRTDLV